MLNDLPADIDTLDNLNISCLDPMLKDYVFSSFFFARLINKTMDENKRLKEENERLVAELGNCAGIRQKVEELKQYIDGLGSIEGQCSSYEKPDFKPMGFMARNRENMKELAGGVEAGKPLTEHAGASKPELKPEAQPEVQLETQAEAQPEVSLETQVEAQPEVSLETQAEAQPEVQLETQAVAQPEVQLETQAVAQPDIDMSLEGIDSQLKAELEAPLGIPSEPEFDDDMNAISSEIVSEEQILMEDAFAVDAAEAEADISADIMAEPEPAPEAAVEPEPEPDATVEPAPEPEPTPEPEPKPAPAVEIPDDPNAALSPEQIAAMFASSQSADAPAPAPEPAPAPAPAVEIPDDPNAALTPEQIAAMFEAAK